MQQRLNIPCIPGKANVVRTWHGSQIPALQCDNVTALFRSRSAS